METPTRPLPVPTPDSQPFWDAARTGQLAIQTCRACGYKQHYPRPFCVQCLSEDLTFEPVSGKGTIYTYTIAHRAAHPGLESRLPYAVALIDLDEGVRVLTNVVDTPLEQVRCGARVEVCFETLTPDIHLPQFRVVP